jgi:hypothetical protein
MYPAARLAFCPNTYKPPSSDDEMTSNNSESCNGWTNLRRDLSIAAHDAGNPLYPMDLKNPRKRNKQLYLLMWNILLKH